MLQAASGDTAAHRLLHIRYAAGQFSLVMDRLEQSPLPRRTTARPRGRFRVRALDAKKQTRFVTQLADPTVLRGEFADDDGAIEAVHLPHPGVTSFLLRLPDLAFRTLVFERWQPGASAEGSWAFAGSLSFGSAS